MFILKTCQKTKLLNRIGGYDMNQNCSIRIKTQDEMIDTSNFTGAHMAWNILYASIVPDEVRFHIST